MVLGQVPSEPESLSRLSSTLGWNFGLVQGDQKFKKSSNHSSWWNMWKWKCLALGPPKLTISSFCVAYLVKLKMTLVTMNTTQNWPDSLRRCLPWVLISGSELVCLCLLFLSPFFGASATYMNSKEYRIPAVVVSQKLVQKAMFRGTKMASKVHHCFEIFLLTTWLLSFLASATCCIQLASLHRFLGAAHVL